MDTQEWGALAVGAVLLAIVGALCIRSYLKLTATRKKIVPSAKSITIDEAATAFIQTVSPVDRMKLARLAMMFNGSDPVDLRGMVSEALSIDFHAFTGSAVILAWKGGWGESSKLRYLAEQDYKDMLFALAEDIGFIKSCISAAPFLEDYLGYYNLRPSHERIVPRHLMVDWPLVTALLNANRSLLPTR